MFKEGEQVIILRPAEGLEDAGVIDNQLGMRLPIIKYDAKSNLYSLGKYYYKAESLKSYEPEEPEEPETPQAMRFNNGKPELSYMLDFPKTMTAISDPEFLPDTYRKEKGEVDTSNYMYLENAKDDMFKTLMDFQNGGNLDILTACIHVLLGELQKDLTGNSVHKSYEHCMIVKVSHLAAAYPNAWNEFVTVCANGALKYARDNWKTGFPYRQLIDCALRHYRKFLHGVKRDELDPKMIDRWEMDSDLREYFEEDFQSFEERFNTHHLAHVIWNLAVIIEIEEKWDDRNIG